MFHKLYRIMKACRERVLEVEKCFKGNAVPGARLNTQGYKGALVLFIVMAVSGAMFGGVYGAVSGPKGQGAAVSLGEQRIGDVIHTAQFDISVPVIAVKQKVGSGYITSEADEGYIYLVVLWHYKGTAETLNGPPLPVLQLLDRSGAEIPADFSASGSYAAQMNLVPEVFRELIPGETVENAHVFMISKERYAEGGWRLQIRADRDIHMTVN